MSIFGTILKFALPFIVIPFQLLFKLLTPKLQSPGTQPATEQVYDANLQQNVPKIGDPQTVLYGLTWQYPAVRAQPWFEFVNNDQITHLQMRVSVGIVSMLALRVGKTPISAFSGTQVQLCRPGEPMTLFHPNVYTNPQVQGVDVVGGALQRSSYDVTVTLGGGSGTRIDTSPDTTFGSFGLVAGAKVGGEVTITGTAGDDGSYTITAVDPAGQYLDTSHSFTAATVDVSLSFDAYDLRLNDALQSPLVNLAFDATLSTITAAPDTSYPNDLSKFAIGDQITATDAGAGANRNVTFTVLDVGGSDGLSLVVTPPPTTTTGNSTVVLLRRYHGPYDVCPAGDTCNRVAFDLQFPQGIGNLDTKKGSIAAITVTFDAQWRPVDDGGVPLADWTSFAPLVITDVSRKVYRRSFAYDLPSACRAQVRIARSSKDNSGNDILDAVQIAGVRGYVVDKTGEDARVDTDSTLLAVSIRASGQLANGDDHKINGQFQRWLETWSEAGGWTAEVPTSSVAWAALDKLRGRYAAKGRPVPDSALDLPGFAALDATLAARGDTFNGSFSTLGNLRDGINTVLRLGRAQLYYNWLTAQYSIYRDAPTDPVQLFTDQISATSQYKLTLRSLNDPTGVLVAYQDPNANEERDIQIADTDTKPNKLDLRNGCTSRQTAWNEANYEWNLERYRRATVTVDCELEGLLARLGSRILVQSRARGWGQAAEVVSITGLTLTVWPPLDWTGSGWSVTFRGPEGAPGASIPVTRGSADDQVLLSAAPDVALTGDDTGEERTRLAFGVTGDAPQLLIVNSVAWKTGDAGGHQATLNCTLEDLRVHADPGTAPVDPYALVITPPDLTITGLALSSASGVISATWDAVTNAILYDVQWQLAGDFNWTTAARTTRTQAAFSVPAAGVYNVQVRCYGPGGAIGQYTMGTLTVADGTGGAGTLNVSLTPPLLVASTTTGTAVTFSAYAVAGGGVPPYTYAWTKLSGGAITASTPSAVTTTFQATGLYPGEVRSAVYKVAVTDAAMSTADSAETVSIDITERSGGS